MKASSLMNLLAKQSAKNVLDVKLC